MAERRSIRSSSSSRYERLVSSRGDDENVSRSRRCFWFKKMNGRRKGVRISRSRKLNWKPFSIMIVPRKIADLCGVLVKRMKMEDLCPAVIFSCQWGLPVISHSNNNAFNSRRNSAFYLERALAHY